MYFEGSEDCSIRDSLITSEYRDMSDVIDSRYSVFEEKLSFIKIPEIITTATNTTEVTTITTISEEITDTNVVSESIFTEDEITSVDSLTNTDIISSEGTDGR